MSEARLDVERDPVYAAAAEWLARLRQPNPSLEMVCAWQQWMALESRHRQVFEELEEMWDLFGRVAQPQPAGLRELEADTYDGSVPVGDWIGARRKPPGAGLRRWALAALLLIALSCVGVGSWFVPALVSGLRAGVDYATSVGENADIRLADGSTVQLGGHTRIRVTLGTRQRRIDLLSGEACFDVAKDPTRPFLVRAGNANVTAVGTEFNIRRNGDRVVVSVLEGRVLVQPLAAANSLAWLGPAVPTGSAAPLKAGQRTTVNRGGLEPTQALTDSSSAVAWQHGRLAFESEPLRYVLQDVNRYAAKPIVLADERTGDLRITGTVTQANIMGWVNSLQAAFGIRAEVDSDHIVLRP